MIQNEYNTNNMSICESICNFIEYDRETKNSKCECDIKNKQIIISELMNQTDMLSYKSCS